MRCWVTSSGTFQGYSRPRLQRLLDEGVEQHRWRVYEIKKQGHTYISLWYGSFSTTITIPDCHCGIHFVHRVFSYDFKEAFEVRAVMKCGQRNIERNTSGSGISFFFFFNVTARHRLDSHSREIFLFSLH